jgi:outer membrane protein OmpA-like peptidoglycan-associated protein
MNSNHLLVAALTTTLTLGGCASIDNNNTTRGAAIGAVVGAVAGKATGNHKNKRLAIGAALGALTGAAVGRYMDNQEQALREQLSGTGVKVYRDGDILRLDIPAQVTFAVGRSDIRADLYPVLNDIAKVLGEYEKTMLVITGHTDDTGPMALNMQLSQGRADSVKQYLIAQQVNPIRLETRGVGPNYPAVPNTNEANRAMNRRVEIHIEPVTE